MMRKLFLAPLLGILLLLLLTAAPAAAADDEVVNVTWPVSNLTTLGINYLEMDVAMGKRFMMTEGVIGYTDNSTALFTGSGYIIGDRIFFKLLTGTEIYMVAVTLNQQLDGSIKVFSLDGEQVAAGTLGAARLQ